MIRRLSATIDTCLRRKLLQHLGIALHNSEQRFRGPARGAPALLPVLYGVNRNIEQFRTFPLSEIDRPSGGHRQELFLGVRSPLHAVVHLLDSLEQFSALSAHILFLTHV